ncbi:MAG: NAD(P)/FAD-dependent oxidoreductase [Myxococcota bacterium]|nr:NAD(P)/FAD-dependent oxidoreductase [Myxococcota bacterium]
MSSSESFDVVVVGGGPAGAVMAWSLAGRGVRVAVVERATFPREKVCGDFVEPGGLRILEAMDCLSALEASDRLPITQIRAFFQSRVAYRGAIPYYEARQGLPPHGYIIPRSELDTHLLDRARQSSATVLEGCSVTGIAREGRGLRLAVKSGRRRFALRAPLVVGADGTESVVARSFGQARSDRRHTTISVRGYVEGVSVPRGEATIWFDEDLYPGYGWMFPMSGGRANVGAGVLAEACHRHDLSVPKLFDGFLEKLRLHHPGCARLRLSARPVGGVVKMYGGIARNHFDGGLLVGDAGSFVDPMTGEGITPGMESALVAVPTLLEALERGRFDAGFLSRFERDFRGYFDPSMRFLDFCATLLRNRHFSEFWLRAVELGSRELEDDPAFGRIAGCSFGGLEVRPLASVAQVWGKVFSYIFEGSAQMGLDLLAGRRQPAGWLLDLGAWRRGLWSSLRNDPRAHAAWTAELMEKWARLQPTLWQAGNPRVRGLLAGELAR